MSKFGFIIGLIAICFVLGNIIASPLAAAFEFDNVVDIDKETDTVTITNSFGLGKELASVKKISNTNYCASKCSTVWDITIGEEEETFLTNLIFKSVAGSNRNLNYKFEVYKGTKEETYQTHVVDCLNNYTLEGKGTWCGRKLVELKRNVEVWEPFSPDKIPIGTYRIKLTGYKNMFESVDWIPSYFGQEIKDWAWWVGAPTDYWALNESAGTAYDDIGWNNLTLTAGGAYVAGKLANCYDSNTKALTGNAGNFTAIGEVWTIAFWFNTSETGTTVRSIFGQGTNAGEFEINTYNGGLRFDRVGADVVCYPDCNPGGTGIADSRWKRAVITKDASNNWDLYINGTNVDDSTDTTNFTDTDITIAETAWGDWIDDVAYYRGIVWDQDDVTYDWNDGTGRTPYLTSYVTLNAPADNKVTNDTYVVMNCSGYDSIQVDNMSLWINGIENYTLAIGGTDGQIARNLSFAEGNNPWTCSQRDSSNNLLWATANRTLKVDRTAPIVSVTSPWLISYWVNSTKLSLNWTITDSNPNKCWFNATLMDATLNTTTFQPGNTTSMNFSCNDTAGNLKVTPLSWNYTIAENGRYFKSPTLEFVTETFQINLTYDSTNYPGITVWLVYNGTEYAATRAGTGDAGSFTRTLSMPDVTQQTNYTFYWQTAIANTTGSYYFNSTASNQTVSNLSIDNCSTYTILLLNYTLKDEKEQNKINTSTYNTSIELDMQLFPSGSNATYINYYHKYNQTNPAQVCINDFVNGTSLRMYTQARYEGDAYASEFHYLQNFTLTNNSMPQNINLFDITTAADTEFLVTYKDSNFLPIEDAIITLNRKYVGEGVYKAVEMIKTDKEGQGIGHFDLDGAVYYISVTKENQLLSTFYNIVIYCDDIVIGDCRLNLYATRTGALPTDFDTYQNLDYSFDFNTTSKTFTVIFSTLDNSAVTMQLNATKFDNYGNTSLCSSTVTSSSGILLCVVPASYRNLTAVGRLYKDGKLISTKTYYVGSKSTEIYKGHTLILTLALLLTLPLMFIPSAIAVIIGFLVGILACVLIFYLSGALLGAASFFAWIVILGIILIWKMNREGSA